MKNSIDIKHSVAWLLANSLMLTSLVGCTPQQVQGVLAAAQKTVAEETAADAPPIVVSPDTPLPNLNNDDDLSGAAAGSAIKTLNNEKVPEGVKIGPYMYQTVTTGGKLSLRYQTIGGDTVYAHAWFYINNQWKPHGLLYDAKNPRQFEGMTPAAPANASYILVGFLSVKGGSVYAQLSGELKAPAVSVGSQNTQGLRSADYNNTWKNLGPFNQATLQNGNASHNLSPAELIYYAAKENDSNPVLLLAKLQDEQSLLTKGKEGDFEWRLARACGYGMADSGDNPKYYGFFPQVVATTYQFNLYRQRGKNFQEAYQSFTTGAGKYSNFVNVLYPPYALAMKQISGRSYAQKPAGEGYFKDFRDISLEHVQRFLEQYSGALKERDLFKQKPLASEKVKYL